jgi:probable RNA-binding protein EIF1AD
MMCQENAIESLSMGKRELGRQIGYTSTRAVTSSLVVETRGEAGIRHIRPHQTTDQTLDMLTASGPQQDSPFGRNATSAAGLSGWVRHGDVTKGTDHWRLEELAGGCRRIEAVEAQTVEAGGYGCLPSLLHPKCVCSGVHQWTGRRSEPLGMGMRERVREIHHAIRPRLKSSLLRPSPHQHLPNITMAPPRRKVLATAEETLTPPDQLSEGQRIARVIKATGNNVYQVELPSKESVLVELPARFRSTIWMRRGSYVLIDTTALEDRDNKLAGEIVNIVRDEREWRKAPYW